jgi:gamma-glutamylcysteine synthetase
MARTKPAARATAATTVTTAATAADAYRATQREVKVLLTQLETRIEEHKRGIVAKGQSPNWAHVGDMTRLREGLEDLLGLRG